MPKSSPRTLPSPPARARRLLAVGFAAVLLAVSGTAHAAQPEGGGGGGATPSSCSTSGTIAPSTFEGCDGNMESNGGLDWATLGSATISHDVTAGAQDATVSVGGDHGKELKPGAWLWHAGNPTPAKTNYLRAASFVPTALTDVFLYLSFQRKEANGDANLSVELNRLQPTCTSTVTATTGQRGTNMPCRSNGDLLLTFDGQGTGIAIKACRWAWTLVGETGTWDCSALDTTKAIAALNQTRVATQPAGTAFLGYSYPIEVGEFGEAVINVNEAVGTTNTAPCFSFGSIWMHSRASSAIDANMEDIIVPTPLTTASCAIDVVKEQRIAGTTEWRTAAITARLGEVIEYRLVVRNPGTVPLSTVVPTDPKCAPIGAPTGDTSNPGFLDPTETWTYTCSHRVVQADIDAGSTYVNTVDVIGSTGDSTMPTVTDRASVTANLAKTELSLVKEQRRAGSGTWQTAALSVYAGEVIEYRLTFANAGNSNVRKVVVADDACPTLAGEYDVDIAPGGTFTLACSITTAADGSMLAYSNTASGTGTDASGGSDATGDRTVTATVLYVQLDVRKEYRLAGRPAADYADSGLVAYVGETIDYRFRVRNLGNVDLGVVVADPKCDAGTTSAPTGDTDADGRLDTTEAWTYECSHLVTAAEHAAGPLVNTVTATGTHGAVRHVDTATITATLERKGVSIAKAQKVGTAADATYRSTALELDAGEKIAYRVRITNDGSVAIRQLVITEDTCPTRAGTVTVDLAPGAVHEFTCEVQTDADGSPDAYSNTVGVTATDANGRTSGPVSATVNASTTFNLLEVAKRQSTRADGGFDTRPIDVAAGARIYYRIDVTNRGNRTLTGVTLSDTGCDLGSPAGFTLAAAATRSFTCSYLTTDADADGHSNTASAVGTDPAGRTVSSLPATVDAAVHVQSIDVEKRQSVNGSALTDGVVDVYPGDVITYELTVRSAGNTGQSVDVTDPGCGPLTASTAGFDGAGDTFAANQTVVYTCTRTVGAGDAPTVTNTAVVVGTNAWEVTRDSDSVDAAVHLLAIAVEKTQAVLGGAFVDTAFAVEPGDVITYALQVTTAGNTAQAVTVSDPNCGALSTQTPGFDGTADPFGANQTVTYTCTHTVAVADAPTFRNTVTVNGDDGIAGPGGTTTATDFVDADVYWSSLTIDQQERVGAGAWTGVGSGTATPDFHVEVGDVVQYRAVVTAGGNAAQAVTFTNAACDAGTITWTDAAAGAIAYAGPVANVAPGTSLTFSCTRLVQAGDMDALTSQAAALGRSALVRSDKQATDTVTAQVHQLRLAVEKLQSRSPNGGWQVGPLTFTAGETIHYRITVANRGNTATAVTPVDAGCDRLDATPVLVAAGASVQFQCEHVATVADARSAGGTYVNTAHATGTAAYGGSTRSNDSSVTSRVLVTLITMTKQVLDAETGRLAPTNRAHVGDTIRYTITVANTGNNTLDFTLGDANCARSWPNQDVDPAETATYTCEHLVTAADGDTYVNTAILDGVDEGGNGLRATATAATTILKPDFAVSKLVRVAGSGAPFAASTSARVGDTLEYQVTVANTGNTRLTFDLTDPACGAITSTAPTGLDGVDDLVAPGANAVYTCTHVVGALDPTPYVNVVRAVGTDDLRRATAKEARADASIVIPGLVVDKQVRNATAGRDFADGGRGTIGDRMEFRHTVTNTGNVALTVTVTDDRCTGLTGPAGFDGTGDVIAPGQSVAYTCSHVLTTADPRPYVNVVVVAGTDPLGGPVRASDAASVSVEDQPIQAGGPAARPTGTSRLTPPSGCQRGAFRVLVTGSNIRMVQFSIDGRLRQTVRRGVGSRWMGRLATGGLAAGSVHRLAVRVTYIAATGQRAQVHHARFGVCRPRAVLPAFAG